MLKNRSCTPTLLQLRVQYEPHGVPNMHPTIAQAREQGLLLNKAGLQGNAVCILVPLGIEEPLISRAIERLCTVIKQAA
jgi:4-aminobutyrate aminotransferase-like enzyme